MTPNGNTPPPNTRRLAECADSNSTHATIEIPIIGEDREAAGTNRQIRNGPRHPPAQEHKDATTQEMGVTFQDFSGLLIVNYFETDRPRTRAPHQRHPRRHPQTHAKAFRHR
jgi:hypothetical protein